MRLVRVLLPLVTALPLSVARSWPFANRRETSAASSPAAEESPEVREPRPQPAVPLPAATLTYEQATDFVRVARRHAPLWALGYDPTQVVMFTARHRLLPDLVVGASDLEALDFTLIEFSPPDYARAYLSRLEKACASAEEDT